MNEAVGDRVVERPIRGYGECYQCRIGEENVCHNAVITAVDHDGAYAGYIAVPESALHPVPDGTRSTASPSRRNSASER